MFALGHFSMCKDRSTLPEDGDQSSYQKTEFDFEGEIIFQSNFDGDNEIYKLSKKGLEKLTDNDWNDEYPAWSPDKSKIAYTANPQGNYDLWVMNPDGSGSRQITSSPTDDTEPSWYADGKRIAYTRERKRLVNNEIHIYGVDIQTGKTGKIFSDYDRTHGISHVSPTQPLITFTGKRTIGWDVAIYDAAKKTVGFLEEGGDSCRARFSKDGERLAYVSGKADGKGDIWLMRPDGSEKTLLTNRETTYDYFPAWSPDGNFVVFNSSTQHSHDGDWQLYVIEIKTGKTILIFDSPGNDIFPDWR
jgi:Tol biopolymer transport system component